MVYSPGIQHGCIFLINIVLLLGTREWCCRNQMSGKLPAVAKC